MSVRQPLPRLVGALVGVGRVVGAARADATPNFPAAIARELGASSSPDCSVCHEDGRVGRGTVNTPFGRAMRARGLMAYDERSLASALDQMEADRVDVDGDGVLDVDAMRGGQSPNGAGKPESTTPEYGCVGRVSPSRQPDAALVGLFLAVALGVLLVRRRALRVGPGALVLGLVLGGSAACASREALSPRSEAARSPRAPRMQPLAPTAFADDLRGLGLDPLALPRFEQLTPLQVRRVMSMLTRSLGVGCTFCHDASDARAPTRKKRMAVRMWNELMRDNSSSLGPLFCDSCHGGQPQFLARGDHEAAAIYMSENYTDKLKRSDGKDVECETCHGDPADPTFLAKWL
jgi:hypothetical protein